MPFAKKLEFAFFFAFLIVWNVMAGLAVFRPERMMRVRRGLSARQMRFLGAVFLVAGLAFCGFALAQLAGGAFKWRGDARTYGLSDFMR